MNKQNIKVGLTFTDNQKYFYLLILILIEFCNLPIRRYLNYFMFACGYNTLPKVQIILFLPDI